ncbi:MAG TPA: hypothetical protein VFG53_13465 [Anaeromyxobacter sp.]|nr:hypothetical protein [Anaeromyxobacter sp.]
MKSLMRIRLGLTLALSGLFLSACATSSENKPLPSFTETQTEKATATVMALNQVTREVTLKAENGEVFDFVAGPQVRNLAQVHVGDVVMVEYTESLAIEVRRADGTEPTLTVTGDAERAAVGEKPAGSVTGTVTASAVIMAIDRQNLRVTLKGPSGNLRIVQVKDPKKLENVNVGDMVYATYTEALGVSVEKVSP